MQRVLWFSLLSISFLVSGASEIVDNSSLHWSFNGLVEPTIPKVVTKGWVQNEIDCFILNRLEQKNLNPPDRADSNNLLRRLHYNLIGLPPSYDDLNDYSFDEKVDELLESLHYGEKWARHWMDVARYSDSNGLDENLAFGHAWRYRDYLIDAFNNDLAYDRFIIEQVAGDLLAKGETPVKGNRLKIATGFVALGPKLLAEPDPLKMEMDMIDEQIDVLGQAILGITIGCARCHDHKSDPISTAEYYSMAGIFKSTRSMESVNRPTRWFEHVLSSRDEQLYAQKHEILIQNQKKVIEAYKEKISYELVALGRVRKIPKNPSVYYSDLTKQTLADLEANLENFEQSRPVLDYCHGVSDGNVTNLKIHIRGDPEILGVERKRGFLSLFPVDLDQLPKEFESGRLELAKWLVSSQNPLTPRVIVNRVWHWHFGQGLVATPNNFGLLGAQPTHPELLDWLAYQFVQDGWSIKSLHRKILQSATWQSSSLNAEIGKDDDPENKCYTRFPIRRLDAEAIRDTWLSLTGDLNRTIGGKVFFPENRKHIFNVTSVDQTNYNLNRRSIYLPVVRNHVYDFFELFDFPDPNIVQGNRKQISTNQQALYLLNSPFVHEISLKLAKNTFSERVDDQIFDLYQKIYLRKPSERELNRAVRFINEFPNARDDLHASSSFAHSMICSNEFLYLR
ncbi:MAG: DUF1553 domain-containing protein [Opitutae bacterium]|jgi:hypothetical protein|nr:DUF1553 domain-containing protein [Opitutae bacterium]